MHVYSSDIKFIKDGQEQDKSKYMIYDNILLGLTTKDARSTLLINRNTLTRFKVSVNPTRKFVLSNYKEKEDNNDATSIVDPPETTITT